MSDYLSMKSINKVYTSIDRDVHALAGAELSVRKGSIHGLLGENGAGKTTLMKILAGLERRSGGIVELDGKQVDFKSPIQALRAGVGMVHQSFSLIGEFTVAQNVVLGIEPTRRGFIDEKHAAERVLDIAERCNFRLDPSAKVHTLTMGQRQAVEITRLLYSDADLLVFDEPTSMLVEQEADALLGTINALKAEGKTIIYISHKVEEMFDIADEVTVLRKGRNVCTRPIGDTTPSDLVVKMLGKSAEVRQHTVNIPAIEKGTPLLEVADLWVGKADGVKGITMDVKSGEIVALAGVSGNGQQQLLDALFGLRPVKRGWVLLHGENITRLSPRQRRMKGMGYIPEDRNRVGSCGTATIAENVAVDRYFKPGFNWHGWLSWKKLAKASEDIMARFKIKAPGADSYVGTLSGGHVQRTVLARELSGSPRILLACEPTMGLDVESAAAIHEMMMDLRAYGRGVLLVSSNMNEILALSDRVYVIYSGELVACLANDGRLKKSTIGEYMLGLKRQQKLGEAVNGQG